MTADPAASASCCGPAGAASADEDAHLRRALDVLPAPPEVQAELRQMLRPVPGGFFEMGARMSRYAGDLDAPRRKVKVAPFRIAPTSVTNAQFGRFVAATGYRTVAETEGWSFVFHLLVARPQAHPRAPLGMPWWHAVEGACWAAPEGPGSGTDGRADHPAVHIAWFDALAYCRWSGLRLPSEVEWERAARGGLARRKFPWGNAFRPGGQQAMNTFEGTFPDAPATGQDWRGTVAADSFAPNGYGLFNMTGNVWEWAADRFGPLPGGAQVPRAGTERVQRGGSYLCHASYCDRYHVHSRTRNTPDSTTGHAGFRVACGA
ncbi:formylglycine-generating enzyme family protein [Mangrovicoccus algicola]|uniref:Formylglycine-generating enzyme family protein n=1 Tax=Mangrovicoccus algicola TaxID=2771008 RepID=A0A8J6YYL4_9RHOB|nr:formylglycine-generating enzyme family protein [Mangrovicoccus algicola]MBE3638138.1 formylglycine-generating enzyme family protein [Mangrovicoccus algicola]